MKMTNQQATTQAGIDRIDEVIDWLKHGKQKPPRSHRKIANHDTSKQCLDKNGTFKYMGLHESAEKEKEQNRDKIKFDRVLGCQDLEGVIKPDLKSSCDEDRQCATALGLMLHLGLRVGDKSNATKSENTYGCTTLRKGHVVNMSQKGEKYMLHLEFPSKCNPYKIKFNVSQEIYDNLKEFIKNKSPEDEIFDKLTKYKFNKYRKSKVKDLQSKDLRTYKASKLFSEYLSMETNKVDKIEKKTKTCQSSHK